MTFEERVEAKIRKSYVYYRGSVYTKHAIELVRTLLAMAGVSESNDALVERMAEKVIDDLPMLVDLDTVRGWVNNNYECKSAIPSFA